MSLAAGSSDCTTGLSKRIYDYWLADARSGFTAPLGAAAQDSLQALAYGVARAVVDELVANSDVYTIATGVSTGTKVR